MSTANRVVKNTGILYAKMGITMFISLYTTRLILNSLGASDFGIFNIVGGAISMLGFLNAAMASATQRFMSYSEGEGNKENQKSIFNISIVLHLGIAIIVGIALLIAGYFFFNGILNIPEERIEAAKVVYCSLIISSVLTITTVPYDAILNAHENMKYYAIIGVLESLLKLSVAYVCVYTIYDKLITYGILMACIPLFIFTIERIYCHKRYSECSINIREYWDFVYMKDMLAFASWNLLGTAVVMISNSGMGIVMNMFFGTVINAAQGVAQQICGQLSALTTMMSKAINPVLTKTAGKKDMQNLCCMAGTSSKILFFVTSLLAIPALNTMPVLMRFWLKEVPDLAVFFAQCQLILTLCEQITSGSYAIVIATGRIRNVIIVKSFFRIIYLPIIYILFKLGLGAVYAYIVLLIIHGIINQLILNPYFACKLAAYDWKSYSDGVFVKSLIPAVLIFIVTYCLQLVVDGFTQLVVTFGISIILYSILFYFMAFDKHEKDLSIQLYYSVKSHLSKRIYKK